MRIVQRILFGFSTKGLRYLLDGPINHLIYPRLLPIKVLRRLCASLLAPRPKKNFHNFSVFLDLRVVPTHFDIICFLFASIVRARRSGFSGIDLYVVRPEKLDFGRSGFLQISTFLRNIVFPTVTMLEDVKQVFVVNADYHFEGVVHWPDTYMSNLPCFPSKAEDIALLRNHPNLWPKLDCGQKEKETIHKFAQKFAKDRPIVSITIRLTAEGEEKNPELDEWMKVAAYLETNGFAVVMLPDQDCRFTDSMKAVGSEYMVFEEAAWNTALRLALYKISKINLGCMTGPLELCLYDITTPYIIFITPRNFAKSKIELANQGIFREKPFPANVKNRRLVWKDDKYENITLEITKFLKENS